MKTALVGVGAVFVVLVGAWMSLVCLWGHGVNQAVSYE